VCFQKLFHRKTGILESSFIFRYPAAEKYFLSALRQVQVVSDGDDMSAKWEPLLNNLGHTCRKLGKLDEALAYHQQALVLRPLTASTYSAIGYVQTLQVFIAFIIFMYL
jgi:anaphase-promoting complex subunit 6